MVVQFPAAHVSPHPSVLKGDGNAVSVHPNVHLLDFRTEPSRILVVRADVFTVIGLRGCEIDRPKATIIIIINW